MDASSTFNLSMEGRPCRKTEIWEEDTKAGGSSLVDRVDWYIRRCAESIGRRVCRIKKARVFPSLLPVQPAPMLADQEKSPRLHEISCLQMIEVHTTRELASVESDRVRSRYFPLIYQRCHFPAEGVVDPESCEL